MAANMFATMLHRSTHRMAFLLIYTALEWILIIFLLLNAIFSYLIAKFAAFFGLNPPCILCSRIDHLFEGGKGRSSCRDFLCDSHAGEVSKLGFCSNHRRLADSGDMCEDCAASKPGEADRSFSLLSWMKRSEQGEKDLRCSCCGVALESGFYSPYLVLKTESWDVLECVQREKLGLDECFELKELEKGKEQKEEEGGKMQDLKDENLLPPPRVAVEDASMDLLAFRVEKVTDLERITPIELIDSITSAKSPPLEILTVAEEEIMAVPSAETEESENVTVHEEHSYLLLPAEEPHDDFSTHAKNVELVPQAEESEEQQASEEDGKVSDESNCEISIGSEICDQEQIDQTQFHEIVSRPDAMALQHQNQNGFTETFTKEPETETELSICPIVHEVEEDRMMPETPTTPNYTYCFPLLQRRFLLERRESGTDSLDGSFAVDSDNLEPPTMDRLKTALKTERKALIALYAELEEERSASAIAANQTMAMITRLQEEKAAMQMEALQYQRMMEEQSEYDQEALQLLNELMAKREKEKQELEKKLEVYGQKIRAYEAMERKVAKGCGSRTSSSAEESDDLSIESHEGEESYQNIRNSEFLGSMEEGEDAAVQHIIQFEEERLSTLEQLKVLKDKLFRAENVNSLPIDNGHGIENGMSLNGRDCSELKSAGGCGNRLLPLFDVISLEKEEDDGGHKKLAFVEEVNHVYGRLQALETDCEFLKHCLSSLKKGDRGLDLLQEILQHLRDLRIKENNSC